ncbi:MAG TPA: HD domain-containing protein [Paraburkholderia sp.]|jgi:phosphonate degradation associated HDIG domain protein
MALNLEDIGQLFETWGALDYGNEQVTQLEHALQSGGLAQEEGADEELVAAAFLHDIGHLLSRQGGTPAARGVDDVHQYYALPFLRPVLPDSVLEPIRLHVDAKRYLCAVDSAYFDCLSPGSVRSLELQGGIFTEAQAADFATRPYALDAVKLRRWDDRAKVRGKATPDLDTFLSVVDRVMQQHAQA